MHMSHNRCFNAENLVSFKCTYDKEKFHHRDNSIMHWMQSMVFRNAEI